MATPYRVTGGGGVPLVDRGDGCLDEPLEQVLDVPVELAVLDRDGCLTREGLNDLDLALAVGEYVRIGVVIVVDDRARVALAVDQLKHAHHPVAMVLHRDNELRLGAVAVLLVESAIERVGAVRRDLVNVVDGERLPVQRHVSRDAGAIEREGEVRIRKVGQRVVLRAQEVQGLVSLGVLLDEVQTAGIARGEPARLRQNQAEQLLRVTLAHERHADAVELA